MPLSNRFQELEDKVDLSWADMCQMEDEQENQAGRQKDDAPSRDQLVLIDWAIVECKVTDHPVGFIQEPLDTLPPQTFQSHAEVLTFKSARVLGVPMEGKEEDVRFLLRKIMEKEG